MRNHDVLIIGAGAAGISIAASLKQRNAQLQICILDPSEYHYYQAAWTLVGCGQYRQEDTVRPTKQLIPEGVEWIQVAASGFFPERNQVVDDLGVIHHYQSLVLAPGLKLEWDAILGLPETLGKNGVTSNYRYDLAPYTYELIQAFHGGRAIFTQPMMPIKCAGAPQKAMYLSCSYWEKQKQVANMQVEFHLAGAALFGVPDFIPSLMTYIKRYDIDLRFQSNLVRVDGPNRLAWFEVKGENGETTLVEKSFEMLHVTPPQKPLDAFKNAPFSNAEGWIDVDPATLQHPLFPNIFAAGDALATTNAKTAAAVRKQAVVVANNLISSRDGFALPSRYDGYGACPLTVEIGKVVLAEFGYAGVLKPTFPLKPTVARRSAWVLKKHVLPYIYWDGMLKGKEWLIKV